MDRIYQIIAQRKGTIIGEEDIMGTLFKLIKAYLPVAESFGFHQEIQCVTKGKTFAYIIFDHWDQVPGSSLEGDSVAGQLV